VYKRHIIFVSKYTLCVFGSAPISEQPGKEVFNIIQEDFSRRNTNNTLITELTKQLEELQIVQTDLLSELQAAVQHTISGPK